MDWQILITAVIVTVCATYAAWKLMPGAVRQRCRTALGLPAPATAGACGGCDGCGSAPRPTGGAQVVHIVRMPRDV